MTTEHDIPHINLNPMTPAEVRDLFSSTMQGDLPALTVQRLFHTLAAWLPQIEQRVTRQVTPTQQAALDAYDSAIEDADFSDYLEMDIALEVMTQLANSLRPHQAAVEELFDGCKDIGDLAAALVVVTGSHNLDATLIRKLHTRTCERKGWEAS